MPVQIIDVNTTDNSIIQYTQYILTKARQTYFKYYHTFEAHEIIPNIYLGSIDSVYDITELKNKGIKNVISVIADFTPPYPDDFDYLVVNAFDTENTDLSDVFDRTNAFINDSVLNGESILIHCYAGRSRSVSILIAYIMQEFGMRYNDSLNAIKNIREIVEPNTSFKAQLIKYYYTKFAV